MLIDVLLRHVDDSPLFLETKGMTNIGMFRLIFSMDPKVNWKINFDVLDGRVGSCE